MKVADFKKQMAHPLAQLAAKVFADRNIAHRAHWKAQGAGSYAEHIALGEFYDEIVDAIDAIIEADQGMYGLIDDFTVEDEKPENMATYIMQGASWIESNRDKFSKCAAVLALIDDLTAIYLRTSYKLNNLK